MNIEFQPGVLVKWNIPDGGLARIVHYLREGYYLLRSIPEGREMIGLEDDLILAPEKEFEIIDFYEREETE